MGVGGGVGKEGFLPRSCDPVVHIEAYSVLYYSIIQAELQQLIHNLLKRSNKGSVMYDFVA